MSIVVFCHFGSVRDLNEHSRSVEVAFPVGQVTGRWEPTLRVAGLNKGGPVGTILIVLLILLLIGAIPAWPYSRSWGYYPSGGLGLLLLILIILMLLGHI